MSNHLAYRRELEVSKSSGRLWIVVRRGFAVSYLGMGEGSERSHLPDALSLVYEQLRAIARHRLASESPGHTLQATALVHEAWLKVCQRETVMALDRAQFLNAAAEAMRRVLIDHARTRKRLKRGGSGEAAVKRSAIEVEDVADLASDYDPEQ